ncbi:hypothetical protein ABIE67_007906 [Streptomyces sp. V4I8]
MSPGTAALLGLGGGSLLGVIISVCVTRFLLRRSGGTMPSPPLLRPDELRAVLSLGWNGPTVETSANYTGRGLNVWRKPPTA